MRFRPASQDIRGPQGPAPVTSEHTPVSPGGRIAACARSAQPLRWCGCRRRVSLSPWRCAGPRCRVVGERHARVGPATQETTPPMPRRARRRGFSEAGDERGMASGERRLDTLTCSTEPRRPQPTTPVGPPHGQGRKPEWSPTEELRDLQHEPMK